MMHLLSTMHLRVLETNNSYQLALRPITPPYTLCANTWQALLVYVSLLLLLSNVYHFICLFNHIAVDDCTEGDLRLQDGSTPAEGRLEVCNLGSWTTFKANTVDYNVAQVVCRQLGAGYSPECKTICT